jgi:hypothetical protein
MKKFKFKKPAIIISSLLILVLGLVGFWYYLFVYALTPESIRNPEPEHLHFRMQIVVDGKDTDFTQDKFQEIYTPGSCNFSITESPIHFHDKKDQIVHIHWRNLTGGQVLKYYGIDPDGNILMKDKLGYSLEDNQFLPKEIKTAGKPFGENLEKEWFVEKDYKMFVYSGEKEAFEKKETSDFMNKNLEDFFGVKSIVTSKNKTEFKLQNLFSLPVYAHGGEDGKKHSEDELKEINNLIGNVVIFIQKDEPSKEEIQKRFDNLVDLEPSVCGG